MFKKRLICWQSFLTRQLGYRMLDTGRKAKPSNPSAFDAARPLSMGSNCQHTETEKDAKKPTNDLVPQLKVLKKPPTFGVEKLKIEAIRYPFGLDEPSTPPPMRMFMFHFPARQEPKLADAIAKTRRTIVLHRHDNEDEEEELKMRHYG